MLEYVLSNVLPQLLLPMFVLMVVFAIAGMRPGAAMTIYAHGIRSVTRMAVKLLRAFGRDIKAVRPSKRAPKRRRA